MSPFRSLDRACIWACLAVVSIGARTGAEEEPKGIVSFRKEQNQLIVTVDRKPVATYVFRDENISRPYFAHVKAPGGQQVTRNHPPLKDIDRTDHDTMHPGIWLAFGDLDGEDFWRNKARIVHQGFADPPDQPAGTGGFFEEKHYLRPDGSLLCKERFRCFLHVLDNAYLLEWDSTFTSDSEFYFGDQEEMGLGVRVTTAISEVERGRLSDSEGRAGAGKIWSQAADWCDYSGVVGDERIGMTIMCHPDNFRPSWFHARDYGFVAANPFGRKAMQKGDLSKLIVKPGENLRLRYGILIHSSPKDQPLDLKAAYGDYLKFCSIQKFLGDR
ncbi:MAG TPA: PmoA family protein [Planctomycetaceae bacterium]|nr:PmoA family protein [Planctomycetaceae bacterium]